MEQQKSKFVKKILPQLKVKKETQLKSSIFKRSLSWIQNLGKALLFPIAMLPFAAIMLRVGAAIPTSTDFAKGIHDVLFTFGLAVFGPALPFLFAIGVAFGLAKDHRGEAAIIAFSTMVMATIFVSSSKGLFGGVDLVEQIYGKIDFGATWDDSGTIVSTGFASIFAGKYNDILALNVLLGISIGLVVSSTYNRFKNVELPSILGFFSGRRLIPVLGIVFGFLFMLAYAIVFPWFGYLLYKISDGLATATGDRWANAGIMGIYGILNRLLIPFGLHHIPNTIFWFTLGDHVSAADPTQQVHGDIFIFLNGAAEGNTAGTFQSGFFPIMMFGLPAIAYAIYHNAEGNVQKSRVASVFAGAALVSFFTGITEPIEFAFLYIAPILFFLHALLTGLFGMIVGFFGIQLGFGFSAGFIDYVLSIPKSLEIIAANKTGANAAFAHPAWLWVIGVPTALTYFFGANFLIKKFNLQTPGKGENKIVFMDYETKSESQGSGTNKYTRDATFIIEAMGGKENIKDVSNCATRIRFVLVDSSKVKIEILKKTRSLGSIKLGDGYQVVMGPTVEFYANEVQRLLG